MATPWALTPLKSPYQSVVQPMGTTTPSAQLSSFYGPTTSYSVSTPLAPSSGYTKYTPPAPSRTSAYNTLGDLGGGGSGQPGTNVSMQPTPSERSPYSQPQQAPAGPSAGTTSPQRSGALTQPGAYEQWYQQNASRYNQPTTLSSYYQSVAGKFGGQRYQPTTSRDAYSQVQGMFSQPSQGATNARSVADQLRQQSAGEDAMNAALGYFSGPNNAAQYYGDNRNFYEAEGEIEDYYANNGERFQEAGFGENYAQGILQNPELTGLFDNRLVGDELDYFRQPLRDLSYSEKLYESGNEGLNQWYDLQRQRQQEDLENQMSAMGVFGSGETVEAMYRMREGLAAEQARDMAGLAGQADAERRQRADLLFGASGAAAEEEMARGGLMLGAAGAGLELDRDAIARLTAGGNLANQSSTYALNRTNAGMNAANTADQSLFAQGAGMAGIGTQMSQAELNRLNSSSAAGLAADTEERQRMMDMFNASLGVDNMGLSAQAADLSWITAGGQLANQVDTGNRDWLNAGGGAAQTAQNMYETRERYGFTDPFAAANAMAGTYQTGAANNTNASAADRTEAVNLIMAKDGLDADAAERRANEWMQAGTLMVQLAALRNRK
jgi:hypothetical protein